MDPRHGSVFLLLLSQRTRSEIPGRNDVPSSLNIDIMSTSPAPSDTPRSTLGDTSEEDLVDFGINWHTDESGTGTPPPSTGIAASAYTTASNTPESGSSFDVLSSTAAPLSARSHSDTVLVERKGSAAGGRSRKVIVSTATLTANWEDLGQPLFNFVNNKNLREVLAR
jgi:hypothetical protein